MNARARRGPLCSPAARKQAALRLWALLVLEMHGVLGSRQKRPAVFPARERAKQPASQRETSDTLHWSQAFQETSLLGQQLCSLPPPSTAPSAEGQSSELWQGNGVPKEKPLHPAVTSNGGKKLSSAQLSSAQPPSEGNCCFRGSHALCETSGVRHRTSAAVFSNTTGPRGDAPGLALNLLRGKGSSTDGFCYCTCTKVCRTRGAHRNQNTLQSHAELLDGFSRSMATPEGRGEQLWLMGDSKPPQKGLQTQFEALLFGQQRTTWPLAFVPQGSSMERERAEMLSGAWLGLQRGSQRQEWGEPKGAARPQSCSWAPWFRPISLCVGEPSLQRNLLLGTPSTSPARRALPAGT